MTTDTSAAKNAEGAADTNQEDIFSSAVDAAINEVLGAENTEGTSSAQGQRVEDSIAGLEALQKENQDLKEQLMRAVAETENVRKRSERDLQDTRKYAISGFARDLVNVLENLQLALFNIPAEARQQDEKLATLAEGVEMTANELIRSFQNHGIVRINPLGEKFDHNFHQAVAQVEEADKEPGTIVQVLQAGYIIHDRLLRPAMVTVAKAAAGGTKVDTQA